MMNKRLTYYVILAGMAVSACAGSTSENASDEQQADSTQVYCLDDQLRSSTSIIEIQERPITEQLALSGKIEYNENDLVAFQSLLVGTVEQVKFELGDFVHKGQVLATVKSNEIQDLVQQRRSYQSQIQVLENQVETKRELLEDGLASKPEVLEVESELASARIELDRVSQSLQLFKAVGPGTFQILAPKDGYIIQKAISMGQSITEDNEPLFSISNLKQVWVMVNIYARNLRYVNNGDPVKVRTVAYPDHLYTGKIDKIYHVFDNEEHVLKARVVLDNQNLNLMPGLSADIIIDRKSTAEKAFAIPNTAKVFSNNKEYVVIYKGDCQMEVRQITAVASNEEYTYVHERFADDEKVIGSNALLIFEHLNH
ncbi:efflux RND transporter periplasmic adaptor subunit [Sphingobacterium sp. lm-10]|uniref:efflux RND transporter periplasmic adaptor subunit n=1 Tax=Sphingobacterium sp. lm-10 TaxID=2944904 RepID=UPI0020211675|nr:efflux RND transporter periplasmic adaptor subunit [Sphingobacterium sp. lm-10]MCL7987877.1 efflux RND transporter periplasmic adaptor subunit [Sphingobacterium sp. lm-10]